MKENYLGNENKTQNGIKHTRGRLCLKKYASLNFSSQNQNQNQIQFIAIVNKQDSQTVNLLQCKGVIGTKHKIQNITNRENTKANEMGKYTDISGLCLKPAKIKTLNLQKSAGYILFLCSGPLQQKLKSILERLFGDLAQSERILGSISLLC